MTFPTKGKWIIRLFKASGPHHKCILLSQKTNFYFLHFIFHKISKLSNILDSPQTIPCSRHVWSFSYLGDLNYLNLLWRGCIYSIYTLYWYYYVFKKDELPLSSSLQDFLNVFQLSGPFNLLGMSEKDDVVDNGGMRHCQFDRHNNAVGNYKFSKYMTYQGQGQEPLSLPFLLNLISVEPFLLQSPHLKFNVE